MRMTAFAFSTVCAAAAGFMASSALHESSARAQQADYPYDIATPIPPGARVYQAMPASPPEYQQQPYAPPPQYIVQPPQPQYVQPAQPQYIQPQAPPAVAAPQYRYPAPSVTAPGYYVPAPGYYYPPPGYAGPVFSYPPPNGYQLRTYPAYQVPRRKKPRVAKPALPKARFFSLGVHAGALGINQSIGGSTVILEGGGVDMRFRTRGHFGIETSVEALHGSFQQNGHITRDSIPITLSALIYVFENSDANHFNIYFVGGGGLISTNMGLIDEHQQPVTQHFTEYEAHLGIGSELRFNWFAIRADVRGLALFRDDSEAPGSYYANVSGGPVPSQSYGVSGTLGLNLWF